MAGVLQSTTADKVKSQREMMDKLFKLEDQFRETLISTDKGKLMYKKFVDFIVDDEKNSLTYMIYFREHGPILLNMIKRVFHKEEEKRKPQLLHSLKLNYVFAKWVTDRYKGPKKKVLRQIYKEMGDIRKSICGDNLPLAINRAKMFFMHTPTIHLDYMDVIQSASEGLLVAIDKFTPPYKSVFIGTTIGRMTLNMITESSATLIKLSPKDKRILYRYYNAIKKEKLIEDKKILDYIRQSFPDVTQESLNALVAATTNMASIDEKREDSLSIIDRTASDSNPEEETAAMDLKAQLRQAIISLSVPERKVVRLKNNL